MNLAASTTTRMAASPLPTTADQYGGAAMSQLPSSCKNDFHSCLHMAKKPIKSGQCVVLNSKPSPSKLKLRDKWMEFQGIRNWDGLLDPLDDVLRDEILRYGEFVVDAYRCFDWDTASPTYATCLHPSRRVMTEQSGIGMKGYHVVKSLHATCGVRLPNWTDRIPSWVSTRSSWIGYVAVCTDEEQIARLGRRDVVIAYRGTATCMEWIENLRATLTCLPPDMAAASPESMVQSGFLSLYMSAVEHQRSLKDSIREEIYKILRNHADEPLSITVTGHSLGAALATLTAYDIATSFRHAPLVTVVSFGGPRIGNRNFRSELERSGTKVLRIVNSDDPITKVPGFLVAEDGELKAAAAAANWLRRRVGETQWAYAEIGKELRVSSRDCPHLHGGGAAMCHDLKTYLQLVNNFVGQGNQVFLK